MHTFKGLTLVACALLFQSTVVSAADAVGTWEATQEGSTRFLVWSGQVELLGFTGGNDVTDNGIEAANPLNLPQAKNWSGGCARCRR